MSVEPRSAVILAGGDSARMGTDKALVRFAGLPMLARAATGLALVAGVEELVVAAGSSVRFDAYRDALDPIGLEVPVRFVEDETPHAGPVAGLAAGLAAATHEYAAVAPVDAPTLHPGVVDLLFRQARARDAAIVQRDGRLETLWGVYRAERAAAHFRRALAAGALAAHEAVRGLDVRLVPERETRKLDPAGLHFRNLNAPEDLAR